MSKAKILVVEDDAHLRASIKDILELENYHVVTAQDGRHGLDVLRSEPHMPPDLIVSDIMMPYMDGIEFLQEVRKDNSWVTIPFIFLTAKAEKTDIYRGKLLGVDDYLPKPFDADDLLVAVASRLDRHRKLNQVREGKVSDQKKSLLTMLNHEFRTPLTLVVAYAEMLKEFDSGQMSENDVMTFLKGVNDGASRLRRLVENFIMLVELESGDAAKTYAWRKRSIDNIASVLTPAFDQVFTEATRSRCTWQVDDKAPPVIADREFLILAVRELLDNAAKFSPPDSPITLGAQAEGDNLCIWVEDRGRGIPQHEFENIWQTFYQIDREQYEDQGSGSGLAIVRGVAAIHNGHADVESEVGAGSRVSISIPFKPPEQ